MKIFVATLALLLSLSASATKTIHLGKGKEYTDVLSALAAVNKAAEKGATSVTLLVEPGVYWLDNPDDPADRIMPDNSVPYAATLRCDTLAIIATDGKPENTVFAVNRGQTQGALGNFTMIHFLGKSLTAEGITFGNYCNVDLIYPRDPSLNRARRADAIVQAQLGICEGTDRLFARNCRFLSRLNLCPFVGARRSFYEGCYFECTDDALTGSGLYLDCRFTFFSPKPFYTTDSTGAIFLNCDIELRGTSPQYLTKVPGGVTLIDTRFTTSASSTATAPTEIRWTRDPAPVVCYQSNVTLDGKPYTVSAPLPEMSVDISDLPLLYAYKIPTQTSTLYNTPNLLAGDDGWDPQGLLAEVKKAEKTLGRPLTGLPVSMALSTDNATPVYYRWGGYAEEPLPEDTHIAVTASTNFGLQAITNRTLPPALKPAPVLTASPKIKGEDGKLTLEYSYETPMDSYPDCSHITWYRIDTDTIPLFHGAASVGGTYTPSPADAGSTIIASVSPQRENTNAGATVFTAPYIYQGAASDKATGEHYETDFSTVPVVYQPIAAKGAWTFTGYKPADTARHAWEADPWHSWYYGHGSDAAVSAGLVQQSKGARAFYIPAVDTCKTMTATLVLEPCKSAGQGFGSATGQYMDIYMKYNPSTMDGYGLRIERTPGYDHAVVFTLMRFDKETASPISAPQPTSCYRTPCTVSLAITPTLFTAKAHTGNPDVQAATAHATEVAPTVDLSARLPEEGTSPAATAFGLQHTGSVGGAATVITSVKLGWE